MTVVGLQDFLSSAIARQVKPAALSASGSAVSQISTPLSSSAAVSQSASLTSIPTESLNTASLTSSSSNLAQLSSVLQVTQSGVDEVQSLLDQLQALAGQAYPGANVSSATLAKLDSQFQQLLAQIDRVSSGTTYDGQSVLDGTSAPISTGSTPGSQNAAPAVTLPTITLNSLFGAEPPSIITTQNAAQAIKALGGAKNTVDQVSSDLADAQSQIEYASASVQTALTNVDASKAVLSESDVSGAFENLLSGLLDAPASSAQVQTQNLSPSLLSLLQE